MVGIRIIYPLTNRMNGASRYNILFFNLFYQLAQFIYILVGKLFSKRA